jgi:hypothetical protein
MIDLKLLKSEIERLSGIENMAIKAQTVEISAARSVYYDIARSNTRMSYLEIGKTVNVESHTTVLLCIKRLPKYFKKFPEIKQIHAFLSESAIFTDEESHKYRRLKNSIEDLKQTNYKLNVELLKLKKKHSKKTVKIESKARKEDARTPLFDLIEKVPEHHINTVIERLTPMISMLEKASMHNYLPKN